jgi:hypothetical protein
MLLIMQACTTRINEVLETGPNNEPELLSLSLALNRYFLLKHYYSDSTCLVTHNFVSASAGLRTRRAYSGCIGAVL